MSCENACYEADVNGCSDITLKAGLAANSDFYAIVTKTSSSNVHQRQLTTDAEGTLVLPKDSFPDGLFSNGFFNLKIRDTSTYTLQPLVFNSLSYNCVLFKIVNTDIETDDESPISTIQ